MTTISPEEAKALSEQLEADVKAFNGELVPILAKYKLGLGASAFIAPDGRIMARPQVYRDAPKAPEATEAAPESAVVPI